MIILVTDSPRGSECATALQAATGEQVQLAGSARAAITRLRRAEYSAVVFDENLIGADSLGSETLLHQAGTAVPVYLNFAISNLTRLVREVQTSLQRVSQQRLIATKAATMSLRMELTGTLTGILLSSELALAVPALPAEAQSKMKSVRDLAQNMRRRLETVT